MTGATGFSAVAHPGAEAETQADLPFEEIVFLMWLGHLGANRIGGGG